MSSIGYLVIQPGHIDCYCIWSIKPHANKGYIDQINDTVLY